MAASAIPAVKTAIVDALGEPPISGLAVVRGGLPDPDNLPTENAALYVLGASNASRQRKGSLTVESFDIRMVLEVHGLPSQLEVEERMWEVVEEAAERLASPLFGAGRGPTGLVPVEEESGFVGDVWLARVRLIFPVVREVI